MPFKLRKLRITKVDLCKAGANPDADILIYKSKDIEDPAEGSSLTKEETSVPKKPTKIDLAKATPEEAKAYAEALEKSLVETEDELEKAKKPPVKKPVDPPEPDADDMAMAKAVTEATAVIKKQLEDQAEEIKKLRKDSETANTEVAKAKSAQELVTIEKMVEKDMPKVPGTTLEVAKMLQEAKTTLTAESYGVLEKALKAGSAAIEKAEKEVGHGGGTPVGSAIEEIYKQADASVKSGDSKSRPEAIQKIAKANPDLYRRYKEENKAR